MQQKREQKPSVADPLPACPAPSSSKSRMIKLSGVSHRIPKATPPSLNRETVKPKGPRYSNKCFIATQMRTALGVPPKPKESPQQPQEQKRKATVPATSIETPAPDVPDSSIHPENPKTSLSKKRQISETSPQPEKKLKSGEVTPSCTVADPSTPPPITLSPIDLSESIISVVNMDINWKSMFGDDGSSLGISWESDDSALFETQPLTKEEQIFLEDVMYM